jgi:hypothetical protein
VKFFLGLNTPVSYAVSRETSTSSSLAKISNRLQSTAAAAGQEFLEYTDMIDRRRGQEFFKTHPEIYAAMGGQIDR